MAVPPFGAISIGTGAAMATDEYTRERHPSRRLRASESEKQRTFRRGVRHSYEMPHPK